MTKKTNEPVPNGLKHMASLHQKMAERLADNIWGDPAAYVLMMLTNAPGVGKTMILQHLKAAFATIAKVKNTEIDFLSNKTGLGDAFDYLLQSSGNDASAKGASQLVVGEQVTVIFIDDLEECFDLQYENLIKRIKADNFPQKMIVIATSKVDVSALQSSPNNKTLAVPDSFDLASSEAARLFTQVNIEPIWLDYVFILETIFADCSLFPKGLDDAGQELLIQTILQFSGPFPPVIKQIIVNLVFGEWHEEHVKALGDVSGHRKLAEDLLDKNLKYAYFSALDWLYEKLPRHYQRPEILGDARLFYESVHSYLVPACMAWGSKSGIKRVLTDFDFKQMPILFEVAFDNWKLKRGLRKPIKTIVTTPAISPQASDAPVETPAKSKRTVEKLPYDAEGGGGKLLIKRADGIKENEVELSPVEWQVFACLQESKPVEVKTIVEQLGKNAEFTEPKIRSALSRIDDKLTAAKLVWIMQNFPRRGYMLRLQEPEGEV
jgi:hypothetical protein